MAADPARSIRHALLGLLARSPSYGDDLVERLRVYVRPAEVDHDAIYDALNDLREEGSIRPLPATVALLRSGPARLVFEPTPAGRRKLDRWLHEPCDDSAMVEGCRFRLATTTYESIDRLIDLTHEQELQCLDRLNELSRLPHTGYDGLREPEQWEALTEHIARNGEAHQLQATLSWLADIRDLLRWAKARYEEGGA